LNPVDDPAELPPTPDELREAEALAKALEGGSDAAAPVDALEAAALLRAAPLDPVASAAIRARARPPMRARRRFPIQAFAGSIAVIIIVLGAVSAVQRRPAGVPPLPLPPPPPALLAAQARAPKEGLEPLAREMAPYRGEVLVALARRYGARR
jgi:hypothetical protein